MTEAEIIAELTWNVLPSELLGEAIKAVKKLAAERDEARETIAEVEGAMEMPDGWSSGLEGWTREVIGQNKSSQESLVARLDEALASESHAAKLHSNVSTELLRMDAQLAEARAEVERLRPAADLGDAYLASINEDADDNDIADLQDALEAAAARARAARGAKP